MSNIFCQESYQETNSEIIFIEIELTDSA